MESEKTVQTLAQIFAWILLFQIVMGEGKAVTFCPGEATARPANITRPAGFGGVTSTGRCNIYTLALEREMLKMKQRRRIYYSSEQRNLMWDRWQKGDSMRVIAGLFDRGHSSIPSALIGVVRSSHF